MVKQKIKTANHYKNSKICLYKVKRINILNDEIKKNKNELLVLNNEINNLLKNRWIYMKNKKVYYCTLLNCLFPDLVTFILGYSEINKPFDDSSLKLSFNGYEGRIMKPDELKKCVDKEGKIQGIRFSNYTVFLNGIRYINKSDLDSTKKFNESDKQEFSYNIPLYEITDKKAIINKNGYDLKYSHNTIYSDDCSIETLEEIIKKWYKLNLIPEGLSKQSEALYSRIMCLYESNVTKYIIEYKKCKINNKRRIL